MLTEHGLVLIADTRTNAGVDNISTFKKLHVLAESSDRLIVIATAGSLSMTQAMCAMLTEGLPPNEPDGVKRTLDNVPTMFRAAQLVGEALTIERQNIDRVLAGTNINASVSLLLGGRVGDGPLKLYMIYNEGNFIECEPDSPFLQIGELKYGKPILDRTLSHQTELDEAVKVGLISFDSTMRSNLSVGRPLDLIAIPSDPDKRVIRHRIEPEDAYYDKLSADWGRLMNEARNSVDDPPFMSEPK
jgi:putative proteasome-type protease